MLLFRIPDVDQIMGNIYYLQAGLNGLAMGFERIRFSLVLQID